MMPKWVRGTCDYPKLWMFKSHMPKELQPEGLRVDFGFSGFAWIARDQAGGVLMRNGTRMPTFEFYLNGLYKPVRVIGPQDFQAAEGTSWAQEWREACIAKRVDDLANAQKLKPR